MNREQMKTEDLKNLAKLIALAVYDSGTHGIPSGHLYARLMNIIPLEMYEKLIGHMIDKGLLTKENHLLKPGPKLKL